MAGEEGQQGLNPGTRLLTPGSPPLLQTASPGPGHFGKGGRERVP